MRGRAKWKRLLEASGWPFVICKRVDRVEIWRGGSTSIARNTLWDSQSSWRSTSLLFAMLLNARVDFTHFVSSIGDGGDCLGGSVVGGVGIYVKRYHAGDAAEGLRWCARLAICSACRGPTQSRCKPPVTLPLVPCPAYVPCRTGK